MHPRIPTRWPLLLSAAAVLLLFGIAEWWLEPRLGAAGRLALDLALPVAGVAALAAACVATFRLLDRLERRTRELAALNEATRDLHAQLSLAAVLERVVDRARDLLDAHYGALAVVDGEGAIREFVTGGVSDELRARIGAPPRGRGLLGIVLRDGQRLRLRDVAADPRAAGFPPEHPRMRSLLAVPITCRDSGFRGNLYVADKRTAAEFSAEDEETLARFAAAAAAAIDTADLHQRMSSMAVSEDRARIAFEIHDGMAQVLAYVNAKSQAAIAHLRQGRADEVERQLEQLAAGARDLYGDVREVILALNTRLVPDRSFGATLTEFIVSWRERYGVPVELAIDDRVEVAPAVGLQVLRIVQEALSNVRKHAASARARVTVERDGDGRLRIEVADDGPGFDRAGRPGARAPRFGLLMMRERAESVGGRLEVESAPGAGTRLRLEVPPSLEFGVAPR
jgi:signal transduction histidine kinase